MGSIKEKEMELENKKRKLISNLVDIETLTKEFIIEMKYATEDNFMGRKLYPSTLCVLQRETAIKLIKANNELIKNGYRIKIWDAYRPLSVQRIMWDIMPNDDFVANPNLRGSVHNSGFAVDVTLTDLSGKEVEMPTGFDDFTGKASRNVPGGTNTAERNLAVLTETLVKHGFKTINSEWWHYEDQELTERIPLDITFDEIQETKCSQCLDC